MSCGRARPRSPHPQPPPRHEPFLHRGLELSRILGVFEGQRTRPRINEAARAEVLGRGTRDVPTTRACLNLAKRLESHGESYFRFLTTPGIEPTNNLAEQAIRFVVIDRRITQGTRSQRGDRWCERIWTVMATCGQQERSVFADLESAVTAWFHGAESPTLLPSE